MTLLNVPACDYTNLKRCLLCLLREFP